MASVKYLADSCTGPIIHVAWPFADITAGAGFALEADPCQVRALFGHAGQPSRCPLLGQTDILLNPHFWLCKNSKSKRDENDIFSSTSKLKSLANRATKAVSGE
jgi:hypothetical protein